MLDFVQSSVDIVHSTAMTQLTGLRCCRGSSNSDETALINIQIVKIKNYKYSAKEINNSLFRATYRK
jgi:hypothetical protein